ncbi:MAG: type II toxin-antitoxin system VapC family toxin [Magnetococcus sp. DMHC-1]
MQILLDTHVFLWWINSPNHLSGHARDLLSDPQNSFILSLVSVWELAIKIRLGKLHFSEPLDQFVSCEVTGNQFHHLDIKLQHVTRVATLPLHHRDPFDRLLIAQSLVEEMPILSADGTFDSYGVTRLWSS